MDSVKDPFLSNRDFVTKAGNRHDEVIRQSSDRDCAKWAYDYGSQLLCRLANATEEIKQKDKRIAELEAAIEKHNAACEETCDMWRESGQQCGYQEYIEQSEYMARKACAADCPREWVITNPND